MTCRHVASDHPRVLRDRHDETCPERTWHPPLEWSACDGCEPCPRRHCGTCGHRHVDDLTCPECIGEARDNLDEIVRRVCDLIPEAIHRGVASEAAQLAAGAADPIAWRQRRRYGYRDHADDRLGDRDPYWVLGTWDVLVTEHYGHTRTQRVTVDSAAAYLGRNLTDLAQDPDFAFPEMAGEIRACLAHLERVLHDSGQGDRANVGCFDCGGTLERRLTDRDGFEDHWTCQRCRRRYTSPEYHFALRARLEEMA